MPFPLTPTLSLRERAGVRGKEAFVRLTCPTVPIAC
jgi:hypothetical protein